MTSSLNPSAPVRGIYCNRTLNLRSIKAIGYDMDYTLIHYRVEEWERQAYEHIRQKLLARRWPVADLQFNHEQFTRGLIIDTQTGNILKANRFGYVKRGTHGTQQLDFDTQRELYSRTIVDLGSTRFEFLNTLFSLSEACIYAQLVDRLDAGRLPDGVGYEELYRIVRASLDETHMEGILKAEIVADPDRYVDLDPDLALTLLDQREAGKKLLLITNSEWPYTRDIMAWTFDRFLPAGTTWKSLFDVIIVSSRKPAFFSTRSPLFEVVNDEGLLRPAPGGLRDGGLFLGGYAGAVEEYLGLSGDQILYVGDHIFSDVHVSKNVLRWRTALILRELEAEIDAVQGFRATQETLSSQMARKEALELEQSQVRLALQRKRAGYGPQPEESINEIEQTLGRLRTAIQELDATISELAVRAGEVGNRFWGPLMRAGNDKSHMARQVERYADIYLSRVSNFLHYTPFIYLRSPRGTLPHDPVADRAPPAD